MSVAKCPKCGSENVNISLVPMGETSKIRHGKVRTSTWNSKIAVCQKCGHSWSYASNADVKFGKALWIFLIILFLAVTIFFEFFLW